MIPKTPHTANKTLRIPSTKHQEYHQQKAMQLRHIHATASHIRPGLALATKRSLQTSSQKAWTSRWLKDSRIASQDFSSMWTRRLLFPGSSSPKLLVLKPDPSETRADWSRLRLRLMQAAVGVKGQLSKPPGARKLLGIALGVVPWQVEPPTLNLRS